MPDGDNADIVRAVGRGRRGLAFTAAVTVVATAAMAASAFLLLQRYWQSGVSAGAVKE